MKKKKGMYEQYAIFFFALRNHGGDGVISVIIDSLNAKNALLKHEVCEIQYNHVMLFQASILVLLRGFNNYTSIKYT